MESKVSQLEKLLEQGQEFTFQNFSISEHPGFGGHDSSEWLAWKTRVHNLLPEIVEENSPPIELLRRAREIRTQGNRINEFESQKALMISALQQTIKIAGDDVFGELQRPKTTSSSARMQPQHDVFISYASGDSALALELKSDLEQQGLTCFMAEKDIPAATEWQETIRAALLESQRLLILLTPRSLNRPWVLMEIGAAWALGKQLIPALVQVATSDLIDPIRRYQARVIETTAQRKAFVQELTNT